MMQFEVSYHSQLARTRGEKPPPSSRTFNVFRSIGHADRVHMVKTPSQAVLTWGPFLQVLPYLWRKMPVRSACAGGLAIGILLQNPKERRQFSRCCFVARNYVFVFSPRLMRIYPEKMHKSREWDDGARRRHSGWWLKPSDNVWLHQ